MRFFPGCTYRPQPGARCRDQQSRHSSASTAIICGRSCWSVVDNATCPRATTTSPASPTCRSCSPTARFIVPVRDPRWHVASLMKQHRLFWRRGQRDPRILKHMRRAGHLEFGLDRRAINAGDTAKAAGDRGALARWSGGPWLGAVLGDAVRLCARPTGDRPAALAGRPGGALRGPVRSGRGDAQFRVCPCRTAAPTPPRAGCDGGAAKPARPTTIRVLHAREEDNRSRPRPTDTRATSRLTPDLSPSYFVCNSSDQAPREAFPAPPACVTMLQRRSTCWLEVQSELLAYSDYAGFVARRGLSPRSKLWR